MVSTVCCLCVGLITCAEDCYPECGVSECDCENLMRCPGVLRAVVPLSFGCAGNWMKFCFTKLPLKECMYVCFETTCHGRMNLTSACKRGGCGV